MTTSKHRTKRLNGTTCATDLHANKFFTLFLTKVVDTVGSPLATTAQGRTQMNSSGMVRYVRAAASLDGDFAACSTHNAIDPARVGSDSALME